MYTYLCFFGHSTWSDVGGLQRDGEEEFQQLARGSPREKAIRGTNLAVDNVGRGGWETSFFFVVFLPYLKVGIWGGGGVGD